MICDIFEEDGRAPEAVKYFRQMQNELPVGDDPNFHDERLEWELGKWSREEYLPFPSDCSTQVFDDDAQRG